MTVRVLSAAVFLQSGYQMKRHLRERTSFKKVMFNYYWYIFKQWMMYTVKKKMNYSKYDIPSSRPCTAVKHVLEGNILLTYNATSLGDQFLTFFTKIK